MAFFWFVIQDEENEIRFSSKISAFDNIFGLENGEKCKYNKECIVGNCGCSSVTFLGSGGYREPSDSDSACALPFVMIYFPLMGTEFFLIFWYVIIYLKSVDWQEKV